MNLVVSGENRPGEDVPAEVGVLDRPAVPSAVKPLQLREETKEPLPLGGIRVALRPTPPACLDDLVEADEATLDRGLEVVAVYRVGTGFVRLVAIDHRRVRGAQACPDGHRCSPV